MTEIYVIMQHDTSSDSSNVHSAYDNSDLADMAISRLTKDEDIKAEKFDEWVSNNDDESECPDFGDYVFTVVKTTLYKI